MKTQCFSIHRAYEIVCKRFSPDSDVIEHIIIGVHGFAGDKNSSMLEKLAAEVCEKKAALICFDFPAHGDSPVGENMLTVENCKQDFLAVADYIMQNYPQARKTVFATSFGGYISLLCAEKLVNTSFVLRAPAITMPKVLLENVLQLSAADFQRVGSVVCGFERPITLPYAFYDELTRQDDLFQKPFPAPMLIIHGDCDDIVPLGDIMAFADAHKNVRLKVIRGADHRFKHTGELEQIVALTTGFTGI